MFAGSYAERGPQLPQVSTQFGDRLGRACAQFGLLTFELVLELAVRGRRRSRDHILTGRGQQRRSGPDQQELFLYPDGPHAVSLPGQRPLGEFPLRRCRYWRTRFTTTLKNMNTA